MVDNHDYSVNQNIFGCNFSALRLVTHLHKHRGTRNGGGF